MHARVILNSLRTMDIAGRYRGDSFLLYLPETDSAGAAVLVRRMQEHLGRVSEAVAETGLTFSCGVVSPPGHGTALPVLMERIQFALAQARREGKGAVSIWEEDPAGGSA